MLLIYIYIKCCVAKNRRQLYAQQHWGKLQDIVSVICKFGYSLGVTQPHVFKIRQINVTQRAKQKRNKVINDVMLYMGNHDTLFSEQILDNFLIKNKNISAEMFGLKRFQMNEQDTSQLQNLLHLNNNQMKKLQRFVRSKTNAILLCNEHKLLEYQQLNLLITAITMEMDLSVCTRFVNSMSQMPVQHLPVYLVDIRDAISRLCSSTFNQGIFHMDNWVNQTQITVEIGSDKSDSGLQESVCVNIRSKHHDKYNSIVTLLTHEKVDEKYTNYMEIAKLRNKRNIINQLLKFPNVILIGKTCYNNNNELLYRKFIVFPMIFTMQSQHFVNTQQQDQLINTNAPATLVLAVDNSMLPIPIKHPPSQSESKTVDNDTIVHIGEAIRASSVDCDVKMNNSNTIDDSNINDDIELPKTTQTTILSITDIPDEPMKHVKPTVIKKMPDVKIHKKVNQVPEIHPGEITYSFWVEKQTLLHLPRLYVIKLPETFKTDFDIDINDTFKQSMQQIIDVWITRITQGQTQIYNKLRAERAQSNDNNNNNNISANERSSSCHSDTSINTYHSFDSDGMSVYDPRPDMQQLNEDEAEMEWNRVNENKNNKIIKIKMYDLNDFNFNRGSNLNRCQESHWLTQTQEASCDSVQDSNIWFVSWLCLVHNEANDVCPCVSNPNINVSLNLQSMFDDESGVNSFWIERKYLPSDYNDNNSKYYMFAITYRNNIYGLCNVFIEYNPNSLTQLHRRFNMRQCIIVARCMGYETFKIDNCVFSTHNEHAFIDKNNDLNQLFTIGKTKINNQTPIKCDIAWWNMDLNVVMQFDNKGKNMICGIGSAACTYPCSCCEASTDQIYSLPTPNNMSFVTRTQISKQTQLTQTIDAQGKIKLKNSKGVQNASIYNIPAHKHGVTTMHNFEGIFAITMDTFRDMLCQNYGHKMKWKQLQKQVQDLQKQYEQIVKIEEILAQNETQNDDLSKPDWVQNCETRLIELKAKYLADYSQWQNVTQSKDTNAGIFEFVSVMKKHNVNLYYMLSGSIQGVMCGRIIKARHELIQLVQKYVNQTVALLWKHLFMNLAYLYVMLKHKSSRKWTLHELATVKTAYIDWYHQHVIIVHLFRQKGSIGVKCHLLLHDIEKAIWYQSCIAGEDDQRFENVNQLVHSNLAAYIRYKRKDKLQLVARRMNCECLNVVNRTTK